MRGVASAQAQDNRPIRLWSFSELQQPAGNVRVAGASQVGGMLKKRFDFGSAAFNFPESDPRGVATGSIFSTASGKTYGVLAQAPSANPFQPGSPNGGGAHLDQLQAYEKRSDKASLRITITKAVIDAIDANHALLPSECPSHLDCKPIRGVVRFKARAYAESASGDFFRAGGLAYIEGREGRWTIEAVTSSDSRRPLWDDGNFTIDDDVDDVGTRSHAVAELRKPVTMNVPLSSLRDGELFAVHVRLDAETLDRRGRESAVEAFIRDPQDLKPALIETTGLKARGAPAFDEPRVKTLPAARCPAGNRRKAGRLQLSAPAYVTDESTGVPLFVLVTRTGATRGQASATVRTSAGSAQAGRDYTQTSTTVRFTDGDTSPRLVEIPALQDDEPEPGQTFSVALSHPHCATLGKQRRAEVTIVDDVALVRYTPNGDVDTSFGHSGITISDLGNDDFANAIALTAGGQIVVAGHTLGSGGDLDFALARYRADGALDRSFGSNGIVKTDFGAGDDFAEGLTVDPDGRIVAVGRATSSTILDMAVARYDGDGTLDAGFAEDGKITADFHGKGEFGQDVAIQADGKIVAAGYTANGLDTEFALMRINP